MALPYGRARRLWRLLFPPIQSHIVTPAKDDVETPIFVQIFHYKWTARMWQRGFTMKLPRSGERVALRPFVPADFTEHVFTPIAVDVAEGKSVAASLHSEDEGRQRRRPVRTPGE